LLREFPNRVRVLIEAGQILGYLTTRPGLRAAQIGPAVARSKQAGSTLLSWAGRQAAQAAIFVDVPRDNISATRWAAAAGLKAQRTFVRMTRGTGLADRPEQIWASSGPEKG
jgi:hypothetical protein